MLTHADVLLALRDCYTSAHPYPPTAVNIVDLGLVYSVALTPDPGAPGSGIPGVPTKSSLALELLSASPAQAAQPQLQTQLQDDLQAQLLAQIQNRLAGLPQLSQTHIHLRDTPIWSPALLTPAARRLLHLPDPLFPILTLRNR